MKYALYTDGAARGNPGPSGAGVYITNAKGDDVFKKGYYLGEGTNNVAEYQALIHGLKAAKRKGISQIHIYADSELVVRQIQGKYKVRNENLKKLYIQVIQLLMDFNYRVTHIRREKNKIADRLANEAVDEALDG